uniref:Protein TIC 214 n=1 Tax=Rhipsalis teres TaxID=169218 RepID=A0A894JMN3_9CARY|nr:hypothetical chloroplast RF19 [Rhipsalis teres]QRV60131.1 hypothetical chloroplast RF19 [Rhipsalis teres]
MLLKAFPLGSIVSLSVSIINSVVVVGLYYGFLTTLSIGPSYLLLFYGQIKVIEEGGKEIDKEVAAATGLITGQLVMFISIYYTPLHQALGRPHTITFLVLSYHLLLFYWYNYENFSGKRKDKPIRKYLMHNPSIQSIYLISLIYQLLNHFFFPSSMLARLVNIYMFRYNNKMLFVTSSFVGWLIGHILFMKLVRFVLVWIRKNYIVRANRYILSNEYLFHLFGFYRDFIFDFRKYMNRFSAILVFFICLCTFGRMPSPFLAYKINPEIQEENRKKTSEEKEKKEEKEEKEEKDPSASLYISKLHRLLERSKTLKIGNKDISKLDILQDSKDIPTSFSGNKDISKLDILQDSKDIPTSFSGNKDISKLDRVFEPSVLFYKPLLVSILFDYNRWNRPMRYIKNRRFEQAVRNEMSQFYFYTCQNDGKERISFSYPPSLAIFREKIERNISFSTKEKFFYDELSNDWIYTNEQKKKNLSNEFSNRIAVLDKKGLKKINVLENDKIRLCNENKEYLPRIYDPFLNGSYRGLIKKLLLSSMRIIMETATATTRKRPSMIIIKEGERKLPKQKNRRLVLFLRKQNQIEDRIWWINKIMSLLVSDYNYHESEQKIDRIDTKSPSAEFQHFMSFIKDSLAQPHPRLLIGKLPIGFKEMRKRVPRWPYKLLDELEVLQKKEESTKAGIQLVDDIREIPARRLILFRHKEESEEKDEKQKLSPQLILKRYIPGPQLRDLIKGSVRAQKRKTSTWSVWQPYEHSNFFLSRTDFLTNKLVHFRYVIKGIFLKYMRKISEFELSAYYPSFADLLKNIKDSRKQEGGKDAGRNLTMDQIDAKVRVAELRWGTLICGHIIRCFLLVIQSHIRKNVILPLLIIAKNIVRLLLLQSPEFSEDFKESEKEVHYICTYNGVVFSENEFPENWHEEGIQIKVVYPFRLKPWRRSRPKRSARDIKNYFYLTTWGRATDIPYGAPEVPQFFSFFKPIKKKLYKKIEKFRKNEFIIFIENLVFNLFINIYNRLKKGLSKNLSNVNPNLEFELSDKSSQIIKENASIINNQMIPESSMEAQFMNLTKKDSLTQKRMKDLANRRSLIRNQMDQISKIVNISPNKTHYGVKRLESLQNIVQILKRRTARLIGKSEYFFEFFMEKIYVDLFLYILNISRIYTQKFFLESTKKILDKSRKNNERNQERVDRTNKNPIQFILTIQKSHFLFSRLLSSKINKNSRSHSDLSFLSQAYVLYKLSQAQLINLSKLRSVFQYYGTSLFLKNEIKDYFGAQGIIHSELRTKKLPNSGMNQWKNWLKSNYQYSLSKRKWSELVPKKWRNKINEDCRGENKIKKKWNSDEKEQLINSNYQNAKAHLLLLPNERENLKKNHKYECLSYKFLFHEDKKDSYSYRIPFQGNKNKEFSYTNNYNIHKGNLIDMWRSSPLTNYLNIMDIEKNTDRKYFDWKIIHFGLNKKGRIGAWIHISTSSNKNTNIEPEPKNCQIVDEFDIHEEGKLFCEKEKARIEKEKKAFFEHKKDIHCKKIEQINLSHQKKNLSHQKKNLFDWMGMNEEILSRPISIESWFFPEFVLLYNAYKMQPWTIPINFLLANYEQYSENRMKKVTHTDFIIRVLVIKKLETYMQMTTRQKIPRISKNQDFIYMEPKLVHLQMEWDNWVENDDVLSTIDLGVLLLKLQEEKGQKRFVLSFLKSGDLYLDIGIKSGLIPLSNLLEKGVLIIEPIRLSIHKNDGRFIMYQIMGLSSVYRRKKQQSPYSKKRSRDKNNYDLLILENILSSRRRRELRILICLNSRNNKGVDKNPVHCNGNRVNKGSQFFDKSKDLDRDKKKLIKFFLWPNYRLEDLACMNRYWFDTNNGSRFSILRIRMYPRLKR